MTQPSAHTPPDRSASRRASKPKRISASYLENAALYYLQRFDSTAENLRRVLERKVRRAAAHPDANIDMDAVNGWIGDVISKMQRLGYIDDARTAGFKARALFGRGTAPGMIRRKLNIAGADEDAIEHAMQGLEAEHGADLSLQAAIRLAKRRRLGPFRDADSRAERRDKDLAALARNGFDFDTARRVIDAEDPDELMDYI